MEHNTCSKIQVIANLKVYMSFLINSMSALVNLIPYIAYVLKHIPMGHNITHILG